LRAERAAMRVAVRLSEHRLHEACQRAVGPPQPGASRWKRLRVRDRVSWDLLDLGVASMKHPSGTLVA